uniref:RNA helicase n=1 Tax=Cannabis sativa TaxID=3483 RepID=A0A803PI07_CANSA
MTKSPKMEIMEDGRGEGGSYQPLPHTGEDDSRLNQLGYKQELRRGLSAISNFSVTFSIVSVLTGLNTTYSMGLTYGGPLTMVYGWPIVGVMTLIVGSSMAEICSAYPTSGGLYFWSAKLAGERWGPFASWLTGWFNIVGQWAVTASVDYSLAQMIQVIILLSTGGKNGGGYEASKYLVIAFHGGILLLHAFINSLSISWLSFIGQIAAAWNIVGVFVLMILIPSVATERASAKFVFTHFNTDNGEGIGSTIYIFVLGLLMSQYTLTGYDASAHMTEETKNADTNGPKGIISSIGISIIVGFGYILGITFAVTNIPSLLDENNDAGGYAIAEIYYQAFKSRYGSGVGGIVFLGVVAVAIFFCGMSSVTSNSRMAYAFSRDGAMPFSSLWHKVNKQEVPINAVWLSAFISFCMALTKPDSGSNPLALPPLRSGEPVGRIDGSLFSRYSGVTMFDQLPISQKTKDGLKESKYIKMTDIQRAALPHALCGRDILGAAKTGSGKTLAFIIPVLEKLYRERYNREDGVGSIILSPTRELANQTFEVLRSVGRHHNFSAGLLIGGHKDVDMEKEHVNDMNILVCTPGRLLQHMDQTVNFDCSQLQVLILDEADRILDVGFKKAVNAIISQLPKKRQTFLFSATQTKSVQDLARLSLKDPEYLSVHEESDTATPTSLNQRAIIVPAEHKLDMLWSFIKSNLNSKILVFFASRKQVTFVFEAFKKLRPGIPLKCLHGKMKQIKRMAIYSHFCEEKRSVLFCTDVGSRGLDFNKAVNWVVQVDCPDDIKTYIHRVGRTARYDSCGKSVMFLLPSEKTMLDKLREEKIPIKTYKVKLDRVQQVTGLLSALLVKYPELLPKAQRAVTTYVRSILKNRDKEIFDVMKLPVDGFSASLGLPLTPKLRFLNQKIKKGNNIVGKPSVVEPEDSTDEDEDELDLPGEELDIGEFKTKEVDDTNVVLVDNTKIEDGSASKIADVVPPTRVLKKKKLKINVHRPVGTRVVFDEEGNTLPPLARVAHMNGSDSALLDQGARSFGSQIAKLDEQNLRGKTNMDRSGIEI